MPDDLQVYLLLQLESSAASEDEDRGVPQARLAEVYGETLPLFEALPTREGLFNLEVLPILQRMAACAHIPAPHL
jgi:hypothetical protein